MTEGSFITAVDIGASVSILQEDENLKDTWYTFYTELRSSQLYHVVFLYVLFILVTSGWM